MANEVLLADQWLYNILSGDVQLAALVGVHIYSYLAPGGVTSPFVTYSFQGGADAIAVGGYRIMNTGSYQVKGITQSNSMVGPVKAIADRIDALLHRATGVVAGGIILACVRERPIAYMETSNGLRYNHAGGIYKVQVQGT